VLIGLAAGAESDLAARAGHHGEDEEHDHDDFDSIVLSPAAVGDAEAVRRRVADALKVDGVLRIKGHMRVDGKPAPLVVQAVGARVDVAFARPDATPGEHLVVIGLKGFAQPAVRRALGA
jgi:cobalamin biosynthesis protein CobW